MAKAASLSCMPNKVCGSKGKRFCGWLALCVKCGDEKIVAVIAPLRNVEKRITKQMPLNYVCELCKLSGIKGN